MPRQPRIQDEYMIHHVVARGNRKEKVFHSDGDYIRYLQLLERYRDRYNFHLFSYCLMDNHVHLLVQQSTTPLSKFMQGIQQSYTQYFNKNTQHPDMYFSSDMHPIPVRRTHILSP